jgi:FAD/FMN-containing dehydrogenase
MTTTSHAQARFSPPSWRDQIDGEIIVPGDPGYDAARMVFLPAIDRRPAAIIRPRRADQVPDVIRAARESGLELAVRSGGHSSAGHGVTEGGVVLDLARLKALVVDPARRVAWAESGLTAGEFTVAAQQHGLGVSFGDTGSVGIGGITLGGGVGYLVRKYGLTIDVLLAAEIVTADGRLLHVDADHHPDLYWAIRGGGGNFGVATRFQYRLHKVENVTGGMLILPATSSSIASFVAAAAAAPAELSTIANVMPAPPLPFIPAEQHGKTVIFAMLLHVGPHDDAQRVLAPFRSIATPMVDQVRPMALADIYPPDEGFRPLAAYRNMFVETVDEVVAARMLDQLRASTAQMAVVQIRVLGGAMAEVPADATAFAHRASPIMLNVAAIYATREEAPVHEEWTVATAAALQQGDRGAYVNFLGDEGEAAVRAAYPGPTWERLAAVKRKYDPDNVFHLNQNVPPAA